MREEYWFRPKRYGLGAGLPIHWKGWLLLALWIIAIVPLSLLFALRPAIGVPNLLIVTIAFAWISWRKTQGGWRWRWGD